MLVTLDVMDEDEKPSNPRFWTWDIVVLTGINVILLVMIALSFFMFFNEFRSLIAPWLGRLFRV